MSRSPPKPSSDPESRALGIGLPLATLVTGIAFVGLLVPWRSPRADEVATSRGRPHG